MIKKENIVDLVKQYNATQDIAAFAHSFAPIFYDIEDTGDADAVTLAYQVEAVLARMTAGLCSDSELQKALEALLPSLSVTVCDSEIEDQQEQVAPYFFTSLVVAGVGTGKALVFADILPSVGFGSTIAVPDKYRTSIGLPPSQQALQVV